MKLSPAVSDPKLVLDALAATYGTEVRLGGQLGVDVYRLQHEGPGPDWVVRAFDDAVGRAPLETAAGVLAALGETPFPAETLAGPTPVVTFDAGGAERHLLVTEYVEYRPQPKRGFLLAWCAGLMARLATKSGETLAPGGGWHRLGRHRATRSTPPFASAARWART